MWLATLIICTTPNVTSCNISTRPGDLIRTEKECSAVVEVAVEDVSPHAYYVSGGCVKIGGYV